VRTWLDLPNRGFSKATKDWFWRTWLDDRRKGRPRLDRATPNPKCCIKFPGPFKFPGPWLPVKEILIFLACLALPLASYFMLHYRGSFHCFLVPGWSPLFYPSCPPTYSITDHHTSHLYTYIYLKAGNQRCKANDDLGICHLPATVDQLAEVGKSWQELVDQLWPLQSCNPEKHK
jgi:hypothetical protein